MIQAVHDINSSIISYFEDGAFLWLFAAALLYLFFFEKDLRRTLVYPSLLVMLFIFNPVLYELVYRKVLLYACWRTLWLLPVLPVVMAAFCRLVRKSTRTLVRVTVLFILSLVIVLSGDNLYTSDLGNYARFEKAPNPHKIPPEAIHVANTLLELSDQPKALVSSTLASYIRQYSGSIQIMYGRTGCEGDYMGALSLVPSNMECDFPNYLFVHYAMKHHGFEYMVAPQVTATDEEMRQCGFIKKASVDGYDIYELDQQMDFSTGGWQLSRHNSLIDPDVFYYTLVNAAREMILIDSGLPQEAYYFKMMINQHPKDISSWIITNPHTAENSTLQWIVQNDFDISIGNVYSPDSTSFDDVLTEHCHVTLLTPENPVLVEDIRLEVVNMPVMQNNSSLEFRLVGKENAVHFSPDAMPTGITVIR